jgi:hypothetical protein
MTMSACADDSEDRRCDTCCKLSEYIASFLKPDCQTSFEAVDLGALSDISRKTYCPICQLLSRSIWRNPLNEGRLQQSPYQELAIGFDDMNDNAFILRAKSPNPMRIEPIYLLTTTGHLNQPRARLVDKSSMDVKLMRKWLKCCHEWHGDACDLSPAIRAETPPTQMRLIDVSLGCLIRASGSNRYIALSYVWGSTRMLQATTASLPYYERHGSLTAHNAHLPSTIRDTISLVSELGERYLWVDALCIVQDDHEEKHQQISRMDSIYKNAYLTIIAASGTKADDGLPGVGSTIRNLTQDVAEIAPGQYLVAAQLSFTYFLGGCTTNGWDKRSFDCTWNMRAWTYQERIFSRRSLIFLNQTVFFQCQRMIWSEDVAAEEKNIYRYFQMEDTFERLDHNRQSISGSIFPELRGYSLAHSSWPDFPQYRRVISEYVERKLSYESDILAALAGIISTMSRQFPGGFHHGLPEQFFDIALLWQPKTKLTRRQHPADTSTHSHFPSWSWAGWVGTFDFREWIFGDEYIRSLDFPPMFVWIEPLIKWGKGKATCNNPHFVKNSFQNYRSFKFDDGKLDLPKGWARYDETDYIYDDYPQLNQQFYYTHESSPQATFHYPIPIADAAAERQPLIDLGPYLNFTSAVAFFQLKSDQYPNDDELGSCVSLVDGQGTWCGRIVLNPGWNDEPWAQPEGFIYEFVAISEGHVPLMEVYGSDWLEHRYIHNIETSDTYHYYNALMIQRNHEVAYRTGLARVAATAWMEQNPVTVDIVLG